MNEEKKKTAVRLTQKAARLSSLTKIVFFLLCILSILGFAFAVTYYDRADGDTVALIGLIAGIALLAGAAISAFFLSRATARAYEIAKAACDAAYDGEDGLDRDFCLSIREETVENLKTILEEQKEDYTPEEYAFIAKVYESKI